MTGEGQPVEASTPAPTRDQLRSRRPRRTRARTLSVKRMAKRELEIGRLLFPVDEEAPRRPQTRAECLDGPRPCPFVSCKYHLYLDVDPRNGAIKLNFPDIDVDGLRESCALDVADRGGALLEEVGAVMNLTRERVRQLEVNSLVAMGAPGQPIELRSLLPGRERHRPELRHPEETPPAPAPAPAERKASREQPGSRHLQILGLLGTRTLSAQQIWRELRDQGCDLEDKYISILLGQLVAFRLAERVERGLYRACQAEKAAAE